MNRKVTKKLNQSSQNSNDYLNIFAENDDAPIFWCISTKVHVASTILENYPKSAMLVFAQHMYSKYLSSRFKLELKSDFDHFRMR